MPLFRIDKQRISPVSQSDFAKEKDLQTLVEENLGPIFNCRLVASEFSTGATHSGRIDTLALSEDDNPVIIEYKKVVSSELVNQSLFYLHWLDDHRGDFAVAAQKALGTKVEIDWSAIRVICIAPSYRRYDLHAVQVMGRSIELWAYRRYANDTLHLEQIGQERDAGTSETSGSAKNPVMVEAGRKAAATRANSTWTLEGLLAGKPEAMCVLFRQLQEFTLALDPAIEESPKKLYVAYRTTQNILCAEIQTKRLLLFLKLDPKRHRGPAGISRDMTDIGHYGTGDLEISVKTADDLVLALPFIRLTYEQIGS